MPDFNLVARSHHTLSTELAKCQNIPSLDNGVAILEAIRDLGRKFDMVTVHLKAVLVESLLFIFLCNQTLLTNSFVAGIQTISLGYLTACLSMPVLSSPCFAMSIQINLLRVSRRHLAILRV